MKHLFLVARANGLPAEKLSSEFFPSEWPRLMEIAFILQEDGVDDPVYQESHLVYPDEWQVYWDHSHGLTMDQLLKEGKRIDIVLNSFCAAVKQTDTIVSHNSNFHIHVVAAEMLRYKIKPDHKPDKICIMNSSISYYNNEGKWPPFNKLYLKLFGVYPDTTSALSECVALRRIFNTMNSRKLCKWVS